ncbi:LysE family translocator [Roseateles asaccharophilus]|uniref:Threonine/homoserine/homoserine lactone efflux protein n=1 Tax=Roseateles asaccharophilus TaxID=582607 RepID=A0ABU2A983_9BURK|nr:LysE family translocator [Roseateles asaccharophilus]MDR7332583.1 threonine/homoserine/homoserine lactone efflux protein [Roseateles asaccharophilus]
MLPSGPALYAFLVATLVLALTPGPGVVYIVTRTLAQGRAAGLASVGGVALGNLANAVGASIGLAALFAASSLAFTVVRWAGAAYLLWLGWQALRQPAAATDGQPLSAAAPGRLFRDGFLVALLNPKTTLFFAAFIPQFLQTGGSQAAQALTLSLIFVAVAAATDSAYALLAGVMKPLLRGAAGHGRYVAALVYFALGLYAALGGARPAAARS